jgi:hypothetical protein
MKLYNEEKVREFIYYFIDEYSCSTCPVKKVCLEKMKNKDIKEDTYPDRCINAIELYLTE